MKRKRLNPGQIVRCLLETERRLEAGETMTQVCHDLGIAEFTYYRWRGQYGRGAVDDIDRLKELEREVTHLKRMVYELQLDKQILKELLASQRMALQQRIG